MWFKNDLIIFTVFEKKRVMEFIITVNSEHMNLSAQLGRRFGEGCEVIARTVDLL